MSLTAQRTNAVIARTFNVPVSTILPELNIRKDLSVDSLDMVELVIALENEFEIAIPDEQIDAIKTVEDAIRYVDGVRLQ